PARGVRALSASARSRTRQEGGPHDLRAQGAHGPLPSAAYWRLLRSRAHLPCPARGAGLTAAHELLLMRRLREGHAKPRASTQPQDYWTIVSVMRSPLAGVLCYWALPSSDGAVRRQCRGRDTLASAPSPSHRPTRSNAATQPALPAVRCL